MIILLNLQCGGRERRWFGDAAGWGVTRAAVVRGGLETRGRGAGRVGDAGRWVVSGVRCGFGAAAGWGVTRGWSWFGGIAETVTSCNSSDTRIGLPDPSRAYQLARWCRFVSIAHREPLQTALQGTFARAMISRKITEDQRPATHGPQSPVSAQTLAFLQFIWHPNRPSRALQGTFRFQVEPNCAHLDPFREPTA